MSKKYKEFGTACRIDKQILNQSAFTHVSRITSGYNELCFQTTCNNMQGKHSMQANLHANKACNRARCNLETNNASITIALEKEKRWC